MKKQIATTKCYAQKTLFALVLLPTVGCGEAPAVPAQAEKPVAQQVTPQAVDDALRATIEKQVTTYAQALASADLARLQEVAALSLLARIEARGPAGSFSNKLKAYLAHEGRKLQREAQRVAAQPQSLPPERRAAAESERAAAESERTAVESERADRAEAELRTLREELSRLKG